MQNDESAENLTELEILRLRKIISQGPGKTQGFFYGSCHDAKIKLIIKFRGDQQSKK